MNPEPLQLGQVLYPIQDTTLICMPKGRDRAVHQRMTFAGAGEKIVAKVNDSVDLVPLAQINSVRAISNPATAKQEVVVMTHDELEVIAHDDSSGLKTTKLRLKPADAVYFASSAGSWRPGEVAPRPGETVGKFTPWYNDGDAVLTIGYDPLARDKRIVALLVAAGAGFGVQLCNLDTGAKTVFVRLPDQVAGAPVAAELIRSGSATLLLVATVEEIDKNLRNPFRAHSLKLHAVSWTELSAQAQPGNGGKLESRHVTTLTLSTNVPGAVDPEGTVFKGRYSDYEPDHLYARPPARAQVSSTVARLRKGVADQQLVLAWASSVKPYQVSNGLTQPNTWTCHVAVIGCGADGTVKVLAEADPGVWFEFAIPGAPIFRVAAADLKQAGVDQLVVGYPAFFGKMESTVALMLYSLNEPQGSAFELTCESKTVVASTAPAAPKGNGRWGEFYLYLAAGVFGGYKAVQIITAARDSSDGHSMPIVCGFVPVDPMKGFPEFQAAPQGEDRNRFYNILLPGGEPALAQGCQILATIDRDPDSDPGFSSRSRSLRFFALPSDLSGQSVVLGAPTLVQVERAQQILAIIQAPPYDTAITEDLPTVSFNTAVDGSTGYSVSTSRMWTVSDDKHFSASLGGFSLSKSIHDSHSKGLDNLQDKSVSESVHFQLHSTSHDYMMVHEIGYDVWRYPVLRSSEKARVGVEVLVIFPKDRTPKLSWAACFQPDFGYKPNSEVGMLLSYCDFLPNHKKKMGFDEKNRLFQASGGLAVVREKGGITETFDASKMNNETVGKNFTILNTVSDGASLSLQTELFDFLPVSFGLNLSHTEGYSDHRVETTHVARNEHFGVSITSGSVRDDIYSFKIVPYIYNHAVLGCLMVAWDVVLTGENWNSSSTIEGRRRLFDVPDIRLIRLDPSSEDAFSKSHSRSISFAKNDDGAVDIVVELFNNSVTAATDVVCEIYLGKPVLKKEPAPAALDAPAPSKRQVAPPDKLLSKLELGEVGAMQRIEARLKGQHLDESGMVTVRVSSDGQKPDTFGHVYWNQHGPAK